MKQELTFTIGADDCSFGRRAPEGKTGSATHWSRKRRSSALIAEGGWCRILSHILAVLTWIAILGWSAESSFACTECLVQSQKKSCAFNIYYFYMECATNSPPKRFLKRTTTEDDKYIYDGNDYSEDTGYSTTIITTKTWIERFWRDYHGESSRNRPVNTRESVL